jgi:hypothetical protein
MFSLHGPRARAYFLLGTSSNPPDLVVMDRGLKDARRAGELDAQYRKDAEEMET